MVKSFGDRRDNFGEDLLKAAKDDHASRKASGEAEMNEAILSSVTHEIKQPVSVSGKGFDLPVFTKRWRSCCVCGEKLGTFYREHGLDWCEKHKHIMYYPENERNKYMKVKNNNKEPESVNK